MSLAAALWLVILAHLVGDYVLQSDWMANTKTRAWFPAWVHGVVHGLLVAPVALAVAPLTPALAAALGVAVTHAGIDHWRLARHVCYAKEFLAPRSAWPNYRLTDTRTGYEPTKPDWLAFWLLIIADNTLHLAVNGALIAWAAS